MESLRTLARDCLFECDVEKKIKLTRQSYERLQKNEICIGHDETLEEDISSPGRPAKPVLVPPEKVPRRSLAAQEGRLALVHAIAHIEFNAINLAWDAVCRFSHLPEAYYRDWAKVAFEESLHFSLLKAYLAEFECAYGDFDAHDGLWQMAERTKSAPLVRMALVPRILEARGLDVTPGMINKFRQIGDEKIVEILERIYEDEIGHVEIGSKWFRYFCEQDKLDAESTFTRLVDEYFNDGLRGPFNYDAREKAGFSANELDWLRNI